MHIPAHKILKFSAMAIDFISTILLALSVIILHPKVYSKKNLDSSDENLVYETPVELYLSYSALIGIAVAFCLFIISDVMQFKA